MTIAVALVLILVCSIVVFSIIRKIRHGSSCCGEHEASEKKVKIQDKAQSHYPFKYELDIDGMHCSACVRRIENALNTIDGVWATASLEKKQLSLLSKTECDSRSLGKVIDEAGFTMLGCRQIGEY